MSTHNELRCAWTEDELLYWGKLDQEGGSIEEMLSQGLISVDSYPDFDEGKEQVEEDKEGEIPWISYSELMSYEAIHF
jgi:8-oxo-dGTP pyrophosphatase MutT (NUDIX family)